MRLIDADEVVETLLCTPDVEEIFLDLAQKRRLDYLHDVEESNVIDFARDIVKAVIGVIKTSHTIDAEPVRHGRWDVVTVGTNFHTDRLCRNCKKTIKSNYWCYCPNCGAKMDEVTK
ncbi:MAG: hypothetical protein KBT27_09830 [Prevotellaceae bacterium]|nr:hypothetical protein [Candidatus Faecinaster equi]